MKDENFRSTYTVYLFRDSIYQEVPKYFYKV